MNVEDKTMQLLVPSRFANNCSATYLLIVAAAQLNVHETGVNFTSLPGSPDVMDKGVKYSGGPSQTKREGIPCIRGGKAPTRLIGAKAQTEAGWAL